MSAVATKPAEPSMVIDFTPSGGVEAMYRDSFSLGFLGQQQVARASDIKHNAETQKWDIHLADPLHADRFIFVPEATGFDGYDEARKMEVRWLELCRLQGVQPLDTTGKKILTALRQ